MALATRAHPVLYLLQTHFQRPYLNMFRGEPAISELDWPFTPTLRSSERFSTHNGSVLHGLLRPLQPVQG